MKPSISTKRNRTH